ncbi:MAG: metallophosphoesterase [Hungatella sp.]|nr:metallophosphoesterase [Hungatella sp.]
MKKTKLLCLCVGMLALGGCSRLQGQQGEPVAGSDIIIERDTEEDREEGPTAPDLPPEETTIEALHLPELGTETRTVNPEIVIASDIHYLAKELTDFGSAFQEMAETEDGKMVSYVWEITDAFLEEVIERRPQVLILAGDLTLNGERVSQEVLAQQLQRVKDAGIGVAVIPGNHDINNSKACSFKGNDRIPAEPTSPEQFVKIYENFGYGEAVSRDPASLSYTYELIDGTWLLMLDSCQYEKGALVGGMIRNDTYQWIDKVMEDAWNEERRVIAVSHHNLLDESRIYEEDCTIEHAEELERKLDEWEVGLFLSGHLHVQHYKSSRRYKIDEIVTSALSVSPCQYGVLQFFGPENYFYSTEMTNVTDWAERKGNPDRNLQDFDQYADEFLQKFFYEKAREELEGKELGPDEIRNMAELYAMLNVQAVAGRAYEIRDYVMAAPYYEVWQEYERTSILAMYMNEILEDAVVDYNEKRRP